MNFHPPNNIQLKKKVSSDSYIIKIDQYDLNNYQFLQKKKKIAYLLSNIAAVESISPYSKPQGANNVNIGIIQKLDQLLRRDGYLNLYKYSRYAHDHNITCEGQILTIIDTLLDFRHPMFRDDNVENEFNKEMPKHRKIFYYHFNGDLNAWQKNYETVKHHCC